MCLFENQIDTSASSRRILVSIYRDRVWHYSQFPQKKALKITIDRNFWFEVWDNYGDSIAAIFTDAQHPGPLFKYNLLHTFGKVKLAKTWQKLILNPGFSGNFGSTYQELLRMR